MGVRFALRVLTCLLMTPPVVYGQESTPPATSPSPPPHTINPPRAQPADDMGTPISVEAAVDGLVGQFNVLRRSFQSRGGYEETDRNAIVTFRGRVAELLRGNPTNVRLLAMNLTLSTWLKDHAEVNRMYEQIIAARPENHEIPKGWARTLRGSGDHARAADVLAKLHVDPNKEPDLQIQLARDYFNSEQFDLALSSLAEIDVQKADEYTKSRIEGFRPQWTNYMQYWAEEQSLRARESGTGDLPTAELVTSKGVISVELFENQAPNTVANFIVLAESGFYDNTRFTASTLDRVTGGDPNTKPGAIGNRGDGHAGYYIPTEFSLPEARKNFTGSLGMWTLPQVPNPSSMFYLSLQPLPDDNDKFTVFGRVVEGMNVLYQLQHDDVLQTVRVTHKRDHAYDPQRIPLPTGVAPGTELPTPAPPADAPTTQPRPAAP